MQSIPLPSSEIFMFDAPFEVSDRMLELVPNLEYTEVNGRFVSDPRLDTLPDFAFFKNWATFCLNTVKDHLQFNCERMAITQMWVNKSTQGYYAYRHVHPNSLMSAVYYLKDTNGTRFFQEDAWTKGIGMLQPTEDKYFRWNTVEARAGSLVVFPSTMVHDTEPQTSSDYRYTLALNSFPKGVVGNYDKLYGMEI